MIALGLLIVLIVVVVYVVMNGQRSKSPRSFLDSTASQRVERPLRAEKFIEKWLKAGLITEPQAASIRAFEEASEKIEEKPAFAAPSPERRISVIAEALGYVGGMLGIVGLVLLVSRYWEDMANGGRLALSAGGVALFVIAGALIHEEVDAAFARLRWFLWLLATAAVAAFSGVLDDAIFDVENGQRTVLSVSIGIMVISAVLWAWRERPVQQATFLASFSVVAGVGVAQLGGSLWVSGIAVWCVGVVYIALGVEQISPIAPLSVFAGSISVVVGAALTIDDWQGAGWIALVLTAISLVSLVLVDELIEDRLMAVAMGLVGTLALLQSVPGAVTYFARDAGVATGLTVVACGIMLLLAVEFAPIGASNFVQALGGLSLIVGSAVTGSQSAGFATIFGLFVAISLIAFGMLPRHAVMSMFGLLGLLVFVPWSIAHYFPGEGRAPLMILVSGALIVVVAVVLSRMSNRLRDELTAVH
jgi:hypothetical protein